MTLRYIDRDLSPVGAGLCNQFKRDISLRTNLPNPTEKPIISSSLRKKTIDRLTVGEGGFVR